MTFDWRKARGERIKPYEKALLYMLAKEITSRFDTPHIVNIGVSWGASVHCLYNGAPSAYHNAIDIDLATRPINRPDLLSTVIFNEADSNFLGLMSTGPVHLLFVDGGHDYDTVKGDIQAWVPHIPIGGIVAFHDYDPEPRDRRRLEGVKRAVDEWYSSTIVGYWAKYPIVESIATFERVR